MANLPDKRSGHSMDGDVLCGGPAADTGTSCFHFGGGGWTKYRWNLQQRRKDHISWRRPNGGGLQLMGGYYSLKTSEIVSKSPFCVFKLGFMCIALKCLPHYSADIPIHRIIILNFHLSVFLYL